MNERRYMTSLQLVHWLSLNIHFKNVNLYIFH